MKQVGVVGLGVMGSGLAKNLLANGFAVSGLDLSEERMADFVAMGGTAAGSAAEVGVSADSVFVMVMNGDQAKSAILGDGLFSTMKPGSVILLTAIDRQAKRSTVGIRITNQDGDLTTIGQHIVKWLPNE